MARAPKEYNRDKMPEVIAALQADKPITKKAACEMLGIAYNTTRLDTLIQDYYDNLERVKLRKQQTRKEAVTKELVQEWARDYLVNGMPISEIAEYAYRTPLLVKTWLERFGALLPKTSPNPLNPDYVPDACRSDAFEVGELVYVNGYCSFGIIKKEITSKSAEGKSKVAPKLVRTQAEWRYSALAEVFLSSTDLFNVNPLTWEDVKSAQQNELILSNQFDTKIDKVAFIDKLIRAF